MPNGIAPGILYNAVPVTQYGPNLIIGPPNGSVSKSNFEDGTISGWQGAQNCTLSNTTAQSNDGSRSLQLTATATGDMMTSGWPSGTSGFIMTPGAPYTMQAYVRAATVARNTTVQIQVLNFAGSNIFTTPANYFLNSTTGWTLIYTNLPAAPAAAYYCQPLVYFQAPAAGEVHYVDSVSVNQGLWYPA